MFNFSFIEVSNNSKTGKIPVTRTDKKSCPDACQLKNNGCYASLSYANIHWKKLDNGGLTLDQLTKHIKQLPHGQLWRHNEAGDLPGQNDMIDQDSLNKIVSANKGKKGYTYTHYPLTDHNIKAIEFANNNGFTINVSCDSLNQLKQYKEINLPKVVIVADDVPNKFYHDGEKIIVCPAQIKDSINCKKCGLCQVTDRKFHIAFKAHGTQKNKVLANM